jgi:ribosomal-protein-alanine N-acetyltransferase
LLEVRTRNLAAIALYRQLGFDEVNTREGYYRDPVDDALVLAHPL